MSRGYWVVGGLLLAAVAAGCCMCASPYDYCGPTFLGRPGEPCTSFERVNSAITGPHVVPADYEEVLEGPVEQGQQDAGSESYYEESGFSTPTGARPAGHHTSTRASYEEQPPSMPQPRFGK